MKRSFFATFGLVGLSALALTSATGCDEMGLMMGDVLENDNLGGILDAAAGCPQLDAQYQSAVAEEGALISLSELKEGMQNGTAGFSMALLLNKSGVNKLFAAATDFKYSIDVAGAVKVTLKLPTIQLDGCDKSQLVALMDDLQKDSVYYGSYYAQQVRDNNEISCITMDLPIEVSGILGNKTIGATVGLPIYSKIKGDDPTNEADYAKGLRTTIFADLKHAQLKELAGLDSWIINAVNLAWETFVSKKFRNFALFDIGAWDVGDGEIKLIAGAPLVKTSSKAIQLGVYSNIVYAQNSGTAIDYEFPENADIGLNIHPDLIRGLLSRMMKEKHVETAVSAEGNDYKVTMTNIAKEYPENLLLTYDWYKNDATNWGKYFSLAFRFWSDSSMCGYIDLIAGLNAEITDQKFEISIGNVHAGKASGAMQLVATAINLITQSKFFQDILNFTKISFNFNQIGVSTKKDDETGTSMSNTEMGALKFTINGNGISLFLNFLDLE